MRPITGTGTGRPLSSSEPLRTRPRLPSITLGVNPRVRPPTPIPCATDSGSLITSMARALLGRRRIKPRSSSAVISRWIPDFERRSSASFISSKEGGTPASFSRSLMNRSNSYCLRVSRAINPQVDKGDSEIDSTAPIEATSHRTRSHTAQSQKSKSSNPNVTNLKATKPTHTLSKGPVFETNHEHTLYVPYVFRNQLILGQQGPGLSRAALTHGVSRGPE